MASQDAEGANLSGLEEAMRQSSVGNVFGMIVFVALFAGAARADETLKFRTIMHSSNAQTIDVGDVDGHILGVARFSGIVSLPDGSTATSYFTGAFEYTKGAGPVSTYLNVSYEDGSVLWLKTAGTAVAEGTKTIFKGTVNVLGGKGKYVGATGDGSYSGARTVPLAAGADLYLDVTVNVKK
jgi:hypothetical protein